MDDGLVSPGCVIKGRVSRSILGPGVVIKAGATARDSVRGQNVIVHVGAVIGRKTGRASREPVTAGDLVLVGQNVVVPARAHLTLGSRTSPAAA